MKWAVLLGAGVLAGAGLLYQTGQLNALLWRFDDPAIRACRLDLIESLKSPSSYKEVQVSLYTGTKVFIEYDAENSYGASIRDTAMCEWIYFDGSYHFNLPYSTKPEVLVSSLAREYRLLSNDLNTILQADTGLIPQFPDLALEACIKATMKPGILQYLPGTYMIDVRIGQPKDHRIDVIFNTMKNSSGMARKASCQVQASRDRSNAVKVMSKEAVYW